MIARRERHATGTTTIGCTGQIVTGVDDRRPPGSGWIPGCAIALPPWPAETVPPAVAAGP